MKYIIAIVIALLIGCQSAPDIELPVAVLPAGTTFELPCDDCGESHTQTIVSSHLEIMYNIAGPDGQLKKAYQDGLLEFLEMFEIDVDLPDVIE